MPAVKRIFIIVFSVFFYITLGLYFLCCLSAYIPPAVFSFSGILSIMFPFVFLFVLLYSIAFRLVNKRASLVILAVIILAGGRNIINTVAFNFTSWQQQSNTGAVRIMTWNVSRFSSADRRMGADPQLEDKILAAIQQYNPDILCLQEYRDIYLNATNTSTKKKLGTLGFAYSFVSNDTVMSKDFGVVITGTAIFSKTAITDSGRISLQQAKNENLVYAGFVLNNHPFRVYSCHLLSFSLYQDEIAGGVPEKEVNKLAYRNKRKTEYKMRKIGLVHQDEATIIHANMLKSPYPAIFCGDINEVPVSYTYNIIKGNLQDAFIKKGGGLGRTFYKLSPTLRIDVCLPDKKFDVLQYTSPHLSLSDHFPIICDLHWAKP